jgi:hypothetical protein
MRIQRSATPLGAQTGSLCSSGHSAVFLQRYSQNFIDVFDGHEFEFLFRFLRNVDEIFFVERMPAAPY